MFFTTNTSSTKISQIIKNLKGSAYYYDSKLFTGFMCQGEIEIVTDKSIKNSIWLDEWKMYYPDGKDSEDYSILKLRPNYIKSYFQFHQWDLRL
ncbi:MAG: hypothetical protein EHM93_02995 [Bacteroidales bacterium]|nr:MAG: hypothetical protein EHM93_02995 [Bacteroidales bacterium]